MDKKMVMGGGENLNSWGQSKVLQNSKKFIYNTGNVFTGESKRNKKNERNERTTISGCCRGE